MRERKPVVDIERRREQIVAINNTRTPEERVRVARQAWETKRAKAATEEAERKHQIQELEDLRKYKEANELKLKGMRTTLHSEDESV